MSKIKEAGKAMSHCIKQTFHTATTPRTVSDKNHAVTNPDPFRFSSEYANYIAGPSAPPMQEQPSSLPPIDPGAPLSEHFDRLPSFDENTLPKRAEVPTFDMNQFRDGQMDPTVFPGPIYSDVTFTAKHLWRCCRCNGFTDWLESRYGQAQVDMMCGHCQHVRREPPGRGADCACGGKERAGGWI